MPDSALLKPVDAFLARLAQSIRSRRLLPGNATILLAVSGGLDSMMLLAALAELRAEFNWKPEVAHFNHQLRGRAADADQKLVQSRCSSLNLSCHVGRWDPGIQRVAIKKHGIEEAARIARLEFLGDTARLIGARHVVLAHHADDQVELFFVRLLRGAGSKGLGGMRQRAKHGPPLNAWTVRPLLDFSRTEIAGWARARKLKFRDDETNADSRYLRNRVRARLLPFIKRNFPATPREVFLRTMQTLADDGDWLRIEAAKFLATAPIARPRFARCHPALQRQVIVAQLERKSIRFDWETVEKLRTSTNARINAPDNRFLSRDEYGQVTIHRHVERRAGGAKSVTRITGRNGAVEIGGLEIVWARKNLSRQPTFRPGRELFDSEAVGETFTLRYWRPGDRFQPIGMPRDVKLQDLFTNAKVPREQRRKSIIATTADGTIFWVEGLRIGERFKLTSATKACLIWRWRRGPLNGR